MEISTIGTYFFASLLWLLVSLAIAVFGATRKIGFIKTLIISVILSPVIGVICVLFSKKDPLPPDDPDHVSFAD